MRLRWVLLEAIEGQVTQVRYNRFFVGFFSLVSCGICCGLVVFGIHYVGNVMESRVPTPGAELSVDR